MEEVMYLQKALILNSGPLQDFEVSLGFNDEGLPKPTVIVGANGSGKSNFLAHVTDALIETAAQKFTDVAPRHSAGGHEWHRVIGGTTVRSGSEYELAVLHFNDNGNDYTSVSKGGQIAKDAVQERLEAFPNVPNWTETGAVKNIVGPGESIEAIFRNNCVVSFPADRSELPYWSNQVEEADYASFKSRFSNRLNKPLSVRSSIDELKPWLVDVLLAQMIDAVAFTTDQQHNRQLVDAALRNHSALSNVNSLLRTVLRKPAARLVRGGRNSGQSKLMVFDGQQPLLPSLNSFSAGQAMLFGIFGTILRYSDTGAAQTPTTNMSGIVLVDEIDTHLHADLLYEVLPGLIQLFPRIQFIISAHSPLFPLGMEKLFSNSGFDLIEMPSGTKITAERFGEFVSSFGYLQATKAFDEQVIKRAGALERPLVLCEGQTDPKYLKTAAEILGFQNLNETVDFDWIGVLSNGQAKDGGEGKLRQAQRTLENNPGLLKRHTMILFDCDQNDHELDEGFLHVRVMNKNEDDAKYDVGIENLLPSGVFEGRFYTTKEVKSGTTTTEITELKKVELCEYLCVEKRDPADFEKFRSELDRIEACLFNED